MPASTVGRRGAVAGRGAGTPAPGQPDRGGETHFKRQIPFGLGYLGAALLVAWIIQSVIGPLLSQGAEIPYSEFKAQLAAGQLVDVTVGPTIDGVMKNPAAKSPEQTTIRFVTLMPSSGDPDLLKELGAAHVTYRATRPPNPISTFVLNWLFPLLLVASLWSMASRSLASRVGGGIFGVGKSKATEVRAEDVSVTFKDVGGADEAIDELQETIQFLKTPQRFARLGGRIPKGVLLVVSSPSIAIALPSMPPSHVSVPRTMSAPGVSCCWPAVANRHSLGRMGAM
jgi:cell division protease FtsH